MRIVRRHNASFQASTLQCHEVRTPSLITLQAMAPSVTITQNGRDGHVHYSEGPLSIEGYWEFGGGDVVTIVSMGSFSEWERSHAWAVARIDEEKGEILLYQQGRSPASPPPPPGAHAKAQAFVHRYYRLRMILGIGGFAVALIIAGVLWTGKQVLTVKPASGVPLGECLRTDEHIACLIQSTDPHLPRVTGRGGDETTSISMLLIPLDGSGAKLVPVVQGVDGGYGLSRIMGSDGHTLWFDCTGLFGISLDDYELVTTEDLRRANPSIDPKWWEDQRHMDIIEGRLLVNNDDRSAAFVVDPATLKAAPTEPKVSNERFERHEPGHYLAAGYISSTGSWFGLHAQEELDRSFAVKEWIRPVESAEDAERQRRFCSADLEPSDDGAHFRIQRIAPVNATEYINAAFVRMNDASAPLRIKDPESALMIHTDKPGIGGKLVVARIDTKGNVLWTAETGIDRFDLSQILPGETSCAFVGTRPPIPNKLSEPLLVLVDNATGKVTVETLWR
jgi:hypothetical protein